MPLGVEGLFTYSVPKELDSCAQPFVRVLVPLGKTKTYTALIVKVHGNKPQGMEVKNVLQVLDNAPILLPQQYKLWTWIADYYMSPIGDVMRAALPSGMKSIGTFRPKTETFIALAKQYQGELQLHHALDMLFRAPMQLQVFSTYLQLSHWDEMPSQPEEITREALMNACHAKASTITALCTRGLLYTYEKEVGRLNTSSMPHPENIRTLNEAQQEAHDTIQKRFAEGTPTVLLHGVTGSGKTEIYIHLIQQAIDEGKQVLYLLPEIALTVQMTQRLQRVFGNRIGIYHSKYSDAERVEIWQKQLSSQPYDIILGARSAVFLPYQRLGLVIVDEEHETSFKQQDPAPRYHGRSVAQVLAQMYGARILLGTATPSAETWYNASIGKYGYVRLDTRFSNTQEHSMPHINVVDVKDLRHRKIMRGVLSPSLSLAISSALRAGEQVILFQNRRGFSPIIECHECGWTPKCPNCDVSLTYHRNMNHLTCHYCGYVYTMPKACPDCNNTELHDRGYGTEKLEAIIQDEFPMAKIARMDLDTTRTRNAYERIIADFSMQKTNILIGTQMVTKGLDFDHVSVVGILSADTMLNQPDFRAWEQSFTMMTQVAGRAGRKGLEGNVFIQTNNPTLPVIKQVISGDYKAFFRDLLQERQTFHYPPFTRLIYIYLKHKDNTTVETAGIELASRLRTDHQLPQDLIILGPDKPVIARIKNLYIRKIMLKVPLQASTRALRNSIRAIAHQMLHDDRYKTLQLYFDVDPQ